MTDHLTRGSPEEAARLKALHVPADFPCRPLNVSFIKGTIFCNDCGQAFVTPTPGHMHHPGTPALAAVLADLNPA